MNKNTHAEDLAIVMSQFPDLTTHGSSVDKTSYKTEEEKRTVVEHERENLKKLTREFTICRDFLSHVKQRQGINKKCGTSYGWKHCVERYANRHGLEPHSIPEGVFVAAALSMGFRHMEVPGTTHIWINASDKTKIDGMWLYQY